MTEEVKKIYEQYRSRQTYYDILGVTPNASFQSIYAARDREVRLSWNRENDIQRINEAYRILSNPSTRREYDDLLREAIKVAEEPVQATVEPVQATEEPVQATEEPVQATEEPVQATVEPVQATVESVQATEEPVQATEEPVQATEEPVQATEEPVQATEEPVQATEEEDKEKTAAIKEANKMISEAEKIIENFKTTVSSKEIEKIQQQIEDLKEAIKTGVISDIKSNCKILNTSVEEINEIIKSVEEAIKNSEVKKNNRKKIAKRTAIILGSTVFFGPIGTIASAIWTKKSGKFKLQKVAKKGVLKSVKTAESEIITEANQKLEEEIVGLLKSKQDNYKLELARRRYQNNIDLLSKRIEHRRSEIDGLGMKAHNRLHLLALTTSLKSSIKWLELMKKKEEKKKDLLDRYSPLEVEDKLADLNEEIEELSEEMESEKSFDKKRKGIKLRKLNDKKLVLINKMQLKKNGISRWQIVKAIFGEKQPKEKVNNETENVKTR